MTTEPNDPPEPPDEEAEQPEPVYDTDEAALVAERLEALGYIE